MNQPTPTNITRPPLHQACGRDGCTAKPAYRLGCRAWAAGFEKVSGSMVEFWSGVGVCGDHVEWAAENPWFAAGWAQIEKNFKYLKRQPPDLERAITITEPV